MKKLLTIVALGLMAQGAVAATSADAAAGGATIAVALADCAYLKDTVTLKLSASVAGGISCSTVAAAAAAGSIKGKGKVFSGSSNGGTLAEAPATATEITGTSVLSVAGTALGS